jgi:cytochrome c556
MDFGRPFFSRSFRRALIIVAVTLPLGMASVTQADPAENAPPEIKYRQTLMEIIGHNMGATGDILKNQLDLPGHIAVHAGEMADSAQLIGAAFKKNVPTDVSDAKAEIWQDWAKFETAIADYEKAARNLQAAASGTDPSAVGPAVKALGKSCGGCHKPFRKPKEESFKNKNRK